MGLRFYGVELFTLIILRLFLMLFGSFISPFEYTEYLTQN